MLDILTRFLNERGMAPHGYCLLWDPALIWTHVTADALIGVSYFSIPLVIATFLTRRRDVRFSWVVWMFAAFIMACGATHFVSIWVLWEPAYGIEALVKVFTAIVSVITAVALWPLLPKAIAIPSPAQLQGVNDELRARIEERDRALVALERETQDRLRAEELLRQSQKMEAVGQLTGGIAHDFNNLLTVVIASLDRARRLPAGDASLGKWLDNATAGAERAAQLTDQLLSFSRRQPLQATEQDVTAIVRGLQDMLGRTLGDNVRLQLDLAENLPRVVLDRNQTENAILNLAINARDAMPGGGGLTIATAARGGRVTVSVTDTGQGMPDDVRERVFEPFFTTKPVGKGTGLGLSQVYGFTKQSGGEVYIESAEGEGTTVRLDLPAASGPHGEPSA